MLSIGYRLSAIQTGIHGGTWICFGVGTLFVLFGWLFLKQSTAASRAELAPETPQSKAKLQQPPILMGIIFLLVASFVFFV